MYKKEAAIMLKGLCEKQKYENIYAFYVNHKVTKYSYLQKIMQNHSDSTNSDLIIRVKKMSNLKS